MFLTVAFVSLLLQAPAVNISDISAKVAEAIDENYLYANSSSWKSLRVELIAEDAPSISSLDRQLMRLDDGDLRIVTADQMARMQSETAGEEHGIGLVDFALTVEPNTGLPQVVTPLVDSPAFVAGLKPGDVILSVNGKSTSGLIHENVMAMLRKDSGVSHLTVRRGQIRHLLVISDSTWNETPVVWRGPLKGLHGPGYIAIHLFTPDSGDRVRDAVTSLTASGVHECILDVRNNPGGYLDAMATAGSAFTSKILGWKVRRDGTKEAIHSSLPVIGDMRLAILVNKGTASAAEILAEGLRDTVGAKLVGSETFGRGQIQTYVALSGGGGIVIPTASAQSVKGVRFNKRAGLQPDIALRSGQEGGSDAAYSAAMKALTHS